MTARYKLEPGPRTRVRVWDEDATLLRRHGMRSSAPHLSDTTGGGALGDACDSARAQPGHTAEKAEARTLPMRLALEHDARHRRRLQQGVEAIHASDVAHAERDSIAQGEVVGVVLADGSGRAVGRSESRAGGDGGVGAWARAPDP